jgi:hypothetical protein
VIIGQRWLGRARVILLAAAACGRSSSGTDGGLPPDATGDGAVDAPVVDLATMCGSEPTTTEDWERCRAKRFCETHVHCSVSNLYASAQECIDLGNGVSGGQIAFDAFESARSVAAGRASINVAEFTQCLREFSPQRCTTAATAPSCALRYTGTVADGQGCFSDAECLSAGATCAPHDCGASCCMGTCTPRAKLGEPCNDYGTCEPGLICSFVSLTCVTGDVGSACHVIDCDAGNWCDMKSKTCKPDLAEGDICLGQDAGLDQCRGETVCAGKPVAHCLRATSVGDKCGFLCRGNLFCDRSQVDEDSLGVCRSLPMLNEPCSDFTGCIGANVRCVQGQCVPKAGPEEPCPDGKCLAGLFCTQELGDANPLCSALFVDGQSGCKQDAHCQSHLCTGDPTTAGQCLSAQATCP